MRTASQSLLTEPAPPAALSPQEMPAPRLPRWAVAAGAGLALMLGQTLLACVLSGCTNPADAYRSLFQWDSIWYGKIAEQGYPDTVPVENEEMARGGFFPGFPLLARWLIRLTGLSLHTGLVLTAQFACWGFWTVVVLFFQRWRVPTPLAIAGTVAIFVQPCAFFLVTGYSESLFLLSVIGFLFCASKPGPLGWALAVPFGFLMTATRIVGLPLAMCPLFLAGLTLLANEGEVRKTWLARLTAAAALTFLASLGGLLFFAFCQLRYGHWDMYMINQKLGWGVEPDYLAVFNPEIYRLYRPSFVGWFINPDYMSAMCVPATIWLVLLLLLVESRLAKKLPAHSWHQRAGFYLCAALMFYISISGLANRGMISMIRYTFCVHVMLILAVVHLLAVYPLARGWLRTAVFSAGALAATACAICQFMFIHFYTHGEWVA
jgi:hypothetical protein